VVFSFFEMLYSFKRRKFEVKSYYQVLTILTGSPFLWKNIVRVEAPSRVMLFVCKAALGKILTLDNLRKKNVVVMKWLNVHKEMGVN